MRTFLQTQWEGDEKHSDDLANLLSNVSRDVWANGQPLDIAQWSDWLDAVLSIRPELDQLKKVRSQLQEDHQEFLRALKVAPLEVQRKMLDKLRDKASQRPWHLGSNYFLSVL